MQTAKEIRKEYLTRLAICMILYLCILVASKIIMDRIDVGSWVKICLAILTSLPVGATFLFLMEYLKKSDEVIRALMIETIVYSSGILVFATTAWGYLEHYANFPHYEPFWWFGFFWAAIGIVGAIRN